VRFLLQLELRQPRFYFAVLEAVASGHTRLNEIKQATGLDGVTAYLETLQKPVLGRAGRAGYRGTASQEPAPACTGCGSFLSLLVPLPAPEPHRFGTRRRPGGISLQVEP